MSPFGQVLHDLRQRYGLRQTELAERMGYEQSYLSALELGVKGPPPEVFLRRLVAVLNLDEETEETIFRAADNSHRRLVIPLDSPSNVYRACNELRRQLERLHPSQIDLIERILRMPQELSIRTNAESPRIKRRTRLS